MNTALTEMLHCLQSTTAALTGGNIGADMTVLERQRARLKWQQQQQQQQQIQSHGQDPQQSCFNETLYNNLLQLPSQFDPSLINNDSMIRDLMNRSIKTDPSLLDNGCWSDFEKYPLPKAQFGDLTTGLSFGNNNSVELTNFSISRTSSCPVPEMGNNNAIPVLGIPPVVVQEKSKEVGSSEKMASTVGNESFKKRKQLDKAQNPKVVLGEEPKEKRIKVDTEEAESKVTHELKNIRETSGDTSKDNSKVSEVQKPDYIHVRARRGQATDSHSLAERVRREKISERMKYLQDLVPGCNKITGKAGMLDEIINYVQSLQRQVEFLSMKLAAVNPRLDFNIDNFFTKDMFPTSTGIFPTVGISQEMPNCPTYLPFDTVQEMVSSCGLDMVINPPEMAGIRRTISAPMAAPETFLDPSMTSCFTQVEQPTATWEPDFQNLYSIEEFHQGRSPTLFPQSFTGTLEPNNLKMEM